MDMLARFVPRIPKGYTSLVLIHIPPGEISSRQARYFVYLREYGYALLLFFFTSRAIRDFSIMVNAYDF